MEKRIGDYDNNSIEKIDIVILVENFLRAFLKLWWIFLIIISVYASVCFFRAKSSYSPYYSTSATFVVTMNQAGVYSDSYYNSATADQMAKTFPYILNSGILHKVVAADMGLPYVPGSISAVAVNDQNLFELSVSGSDPQQIYDVLQSVIKNYPSVAEYVIGDTQMHILDETGVPTEPINQPDFLPAAKAGAKKAATYCMIVLLIFAFARNTVRSEKDLKKISNLKCLGSVPVVRFKKRTGADKELIVLNNKKIPQAFKESIRTMRMRILKGCKEQGSKVIMVTSSMPGEGKSTITVNLALSLAQKDYKVILIDGDLRHPSLAKTLGISKDYYGYGFRDVISKTVNLEDALVSYQGYNIQMLLGSKAVETTESLLSDAYVNTIMDEAVAMADFVIIDTPPTGMLADAAIIAQYADSAVFVVHQDGVRKDRVVEAIQNLSQTGIHMAGCVLNCVRAGLSTYGKGKYGYGYGYGYGGYGYGKSRRSEEKDEDEGIGVGVREFGQRITRRKK